MPDVSDVIEKYVDFRDRCKELSKQQAEEMKKLTGPMENIENWLLHKLNEMGVDSFKTGSGTAFKVRSNSAQLQDPLAFKQFVFQPAVDGVIKYLESAGLDGFNGTDREHIGQIIRDLPMWDMIDFRAGKKGVIDYQENTQQAVPGVAVNTVVTINIRRA